MRTIRLSMILLFSVLLLTTFANSLLPGSTSTGQTAALAAPNELTASDNAYSTKVEISWDAVWGATLYRIFRNTVNDASSATVIGSTAEATFFDSTGLAGQTYFYWVRAENGNVTSGLSTPDQELAPMA